jgi:hypothetical protein
MEAISMLPPNQRCVRAKLQLFLRLWVARQKYEQLRPYGKTAAARIRFHLAHLEYGWSRIVEFQRVLGLEMAHFCPSDQFETVYVIFVERELADPDNAMVTLTEKWKAYQAALRKLSYDLNPYEFGETCSRCLAILVDIAEPDDKSNPAIPMAPSERSQVDEMKTHNLPLKLESDQDQSLRLRLV